MMPGKLVDIQEDEKWYCARDIRRRVCQEKVVAGGSVPTLLDSDRQPVYEWTEGMEELGVSTTNADWMVEKGKPIVWISLKIAPRISEANSLIGQPARGSSRADHFRDLQPFCLRFGASKGASGEDLERRECSCTLLAFTLAFRRVTSRSSIK